MYSPAMYTSQFFFEIACFGKFSTGNYWQFLKTVPTIRGSDGTRHSGHPNWSRNLNDVHGKKL